MNVCIAVEERPFRADLPAVGDGHSSLRRWSAMPVLGTFSKCLDIASQGSSIWNSDKRESRADDANQSGLRN